jgi:hypothetical protein
MLKKIFQFNIGNFNYLSKSFWKAKPFPHVVIDNFLNKSDFRMLSESVLKFSTNPDCEFNSSIEMGKAIYSNKNSPKLVQRFVDTVSSDKFIKTLIKLTDAPEIVSLVELSDKHFPFKYFHEMKRGGILNTHVDHSMIKDHVHFLNSLFYITPKWRSEWGEVQNFTNYMG